MAQLTLDDFERKEPKLFKCKYCGKSFKTERGLKAHITKNHLARDTWVAPDERVEIRKHSRFVDIRLKIRKALWREIEKIASELNMSEGDLLMMIISSTGLVEGRPDENHTSYIQ